MKIKKYELCWRAKWTCDGSTTISEMISALTGQIGFLAELEAAGVTLRAPMEDDYVFLETNDPKVAKEFGFVKIDFGG